MRIIDLAVVWIDRLLSWLPAEVRQKLWFPILVFLVVLVIWLLVRKALPPLGRLLAVLLRSAAALLGAVLLLPDLLASTAFRLAGVRPAGIVYGYGDAVSSSVVALQELSGRSATGAQALARMNVLLIFVLSGVCVWGWNEGHCPPTPQRPACVAPITAWTNGFSR